MLPDPDALKRFHLKNLDCANCAAKIEAGIRRLDGVHDAVVDFASLTLHVDGGDSERIVQEVRHLDQKVEVLPLTAVSSSGDSDPDSDHTGLSREIAFLVAALLFFGAHLWLQASSASRSGIGLDLVLVVVAYLSAGWNVFRGAIGTIRRGDFFDENVLMVIATVGALLIQAYSEAVAVMIFYKIGELLQASAVNRSRRSIKALLAAKPNRARRVTPFGLEELAPEEVGVGDIIVIKPGEKIPLDGDVVKGRSLIDTAALTGESVPRGVAAGDTVMAGQISTTGELTVRVTRPFVESSIARVMDLVEHASARKARTEKWITTFARTYTPAVVAIAAAIAVLPPLVLNESFQPWIYRALVLLVISCPCALVVSIPLGYFGGIGRASREGILVKGSNFIDALAAVKTVIFDKTGTLTQGAFRVKEVVALNGVSKERLLEFAAAAELGSNHPIAAAIMEAHRERGGTRHPDQVRRHTQHPGQGVSAIYAGHQIKVGNDRLLHTHNIDHQRCDFDNTVAHVVVDDGYAGYIVIGDHLRPQARPTVDRLRRQGITNVVMLTGDNRCTAQAVSDALGLDGYHADLLPEEKVRIFDTLAMEGKGDPKIAFVGDGINDAPAIARADVGIAMGGIGSDAAVETADVVLMGDDPLKTVQAIAIARYTRRIVWQNILLAFAIKGIFIAFGAFGLASMWEAVFADMGTALVAVANATRVLRMKVH